MGSLHGMVLRHGKAELAQVLAMAGQEAAMGMGGDPQSSTWDRVEPGPGVEGQVGWGRGWRRGDWVVQWDGEMYNRQALRDLLDANPGGRDPFLILSGWQREGVGFLQRINGPFAVAVWDLRAKTCTLARSVQGLNALFWSEAEQGVVFARDLATLLRCPWTSAEPQWDRIPEYLVFDHVAGGHTLYTGVRELLPGEVLQVDLEKATSTLRRPLPYLLPPHIRMAEADVQQRLERAILAATERLWAAGPQKGLGLFLSGGVDSTLLAKALKEVGHDHASPCLTITCPGYKHDEAPFARKVRERLDLPGIEIPLEPDGFASGWQETIMALRCPLTSTNQVPWWILCRHAKAQGWSTGFTGEGADTWVAGGLYDDERKDISRLWDMEPQQVADRVIFCRTHRLNDPALIRAIVNMPVEVSNRREMWEEIREGTGGDSPDDAAVQYHGRTTGHRLVTRVDQVAACHGIQLRLPFMEAEWLGRIRALPYDVRNGGGIRKWPLKSLCARHWGEEFAYRKKIGFPFPLRTWIREAPNPFLQEWRRMLLDPKTLRRDMYRTEALEREVRLRLEGRIRPADWLLWSLINLELWLREIGW